MTLPPAFLSELQARRDRIAHARQSLAMMEAELRGWEDAMRLIADAELPRTRGEAMAARLLQDTGDRPALSENDGRGLSAQWRNIFAETVSVWPRAATLDEIMAMAERLGTPINRNTLRSQASVYANGGLLERVGQGAYKLTPQGIARLRVRLPLRDQEQQAAEADQPETETASSVEEDAVT